jgi:non-histone protein 10
VLTILLRVETAKSPSGPAPALPASVEQSYRQKCKELKKRILEIEGSNDHLTSHIQRARRSIQRMRLERAFLLEQLEKRTDPRVEDSEGSPSPPPTVRSPPSSLSLYSVPTYSLWPSYGD